MLLFSVAPPAHRHAKAIDKRVITARVIIMRIINARLMGAFTRMPASVPIYITIAMRPISMSHTLNRRRLRPSLMCISAFGCWT